MSRIYAIGEVVYDLIFKNDKPISGTPGGAMLNSSITLGRLELPIDFISEIGNDQIGRLVHSFLRHNQISTHYITAQKDNKTGLALAFLDDANNANYDFYKEISENDYIVPEPVFQPGDLFLFGSFFALTKRYTPGISVLLDRASDMGTIIYYDPNFRQAHLKDLKKLLPLIIQNIRAADIIRGSDEDFRYIFGVSEPEAVWQKIGDPNKILIYTSSQDQVTLITDDFRKAYPVKKITPVSTIGAGDNFNAGIIYALYALKITKKNLTGSAPALWDKIITSGIDLATLACLTMDNYLGEEELRKFKQRNDFRSVKGQ